MNDYDQASRALARRFDPAGFLAWLLRGVAPLVFRQFQDTATSPLPGDTDRRCDTILILDDSSHPGVTLALIVEFQTENDGEILERLLEYVAHLRREFRRDNIRVAAALLNLTGPPQVPVLEMTLPGQLGVGLRFQILLRTLRDEDAGATLAEIAAGRTARCVLPWIPLMRGAGETAIMERWKELAATESDVGFRADYALIARTFAELTCHETAWIQSLEGWNVGESKTMNELRAKAREEVLAEMRGEAVKEGQLSAKRETLLRVLTLQYQVAIPTDLSAVIQAATDLDELDRWFTAVFSAPTLDAYRTTIGR